MPEQFAKVDFYCLVILCHYSSNIVVIVLILQGRTSVEYEPVYSDAHARYRLSLLLLSYTVVVFEI
jgi:hypothetical protein